MLWTGCGRATAAELTLIGVSWASNQCQVGVRDVSGPSDPVLTLNFRIHQIDGTICMCLDLGSSWLGA